MLLQDRNSDERKELDKLLYAVPTTGPAIDEDTGLDMSKAPSWWHGEEEAAVEARKAQSWFRSTAGGQR